MRRAITVAALYWFLGGLPGFVHSAASDDQRPGHFVIWKSASSAQTTCEAAKDAVNGLPRQDLSSAANAGGARFLKWQAGRVYPDGRYFVPITTTIAYLGIPHVPHHVLRYSGSIAGTPSDDLYVIPAGMDIPADTDALLGLLRSRRPDYASSNDNSIRRLQEAHGQDWQQWDVSGQVTVAALNSTKPTTFMAEQVRASPHDSTRLLVFTLSPQGRQEDICVLRRVCECGVKRCAAALSLEERPKLMPAEKSCRR